MNRAVVIPAIVATIVTAIAGERLMRDRYSLADTPRPWVNHDVAHFLVMGRQFAAGDRPYLDWVDANFPATIVSHYALARMGIASGVRSIYLFDALVLLTALFGFLCLVSGLGTAGTVRNLGALFAYFVFVFCPTLPAFPDFGQREQLFTLVLLPWLAWRAGSAGEPPAGMRYILAFLLGWWGEAKMVFLAAPLVVELVPGRGVRRLAPGELWAVVAGVAAPFALLAILWDGSLGAFIGAVPGLYFGSAFSEFTIRWRDFLRYDHARFALLGSIAVLFIFLRASARGQAAPGTGPAWALAGLAGIACAVVQMKGFPYHFIVASGVVVMGLALALSVTVDRRAFMLFAAASFALAFRHFDLVERWGRYDVTPFERIAAPGEKVMVVTNNIGYSVDAYFRPVRLVGPWDIHFTLHGILSTADAGRRGRLLARYRAAMQDRLREEAPRLVLVQDNQIRGFGSLEAVFRDKVGFLPLAGYRRLGKGEVAGKFGGDGSWVVYAKK